MEKVIITPKSKTFYKIKSINDACKVLGIKKIKFGKVGRPSKVSRAHKHLSIIAEAINKGTKLDIVNVPSFDFKPSGETAPFSTKARAVHVAKHFKKVFGEMLYGK